MLGTHSSNNSRDPDQIGRTGGRPKGARSGIPSVAKLLGKALGKGWMKRAAVGSGTRKSGGSGGAGRGFRQRVVVKAVVVRHGARRPVGGPGGRAISTSKGGASLARHVRYLGRDGTSEKGERGQFYGRESEGLDAGQLTKEWHDDPHHFRLIVSPENGDQIADLKAYVREVMARVESGLQNESGEGSKRASGDRLEWLAINHFNTDQPHAHLLLRGVTGPLLERSKRISQEHSIEAVIETPSKGSNERSSNGKLSAQNVAHDAIDPARARVLILYRQTISHGLRTRAEEVATELLGERSLEEVRHAREKEVGAERWTGLDRQLARQIDLQTGSEIVARTAPEGPSKPTSPATEIASRLAPPKPHRIDIAPDRLQGVSGHERGLLVRRLQTLQQLGLASPTRGSQWSVTPDFRGRLIALAARGDVIKTLYATHGTDGHNWAGRVVPFGLSDRLAGRAAKPLEGIVLDHGVVDEMTPERYLVVRDGKGQDHYATVREGEAYDRVQRGAAVVLGGATHERDQGVQELIRIAESSADRAYSTTVHQAELNARNDLSKPDRKRLLNLTARQAEQFADRSGTGVERAPNGVFKIDSTKLREHAKRQAGRSTTDVRVLTGGRDLSSERRPRVRDGFIPEPGRSMPSPGRSPRDRSRGDRDDLER
jgi:hypothetical protein